MGIRVPSNTRHASLVTTYKDNELRNVNNEEQPRSEPERQVAPQIPTIPANNNNGGAQPGNEDRITTALDDVSHAFALMTENIERMHKRLETVESQQRKAASQIQTKVMLRRPRFI